MEESVNEGKMEHEYLLRESYILQISAQPGSNSAPQNPKAKNNRNPNQQYPFNPGFMFGTVDNFSPSINITSNETHKISIQGVNIEVISQAVFNTNGEIKSLEISCKCTDGATEFSVKETVSGFNVCLINQQDYHQNLTKTLTNGKVTFTFDSLQKTIFGGDSVDVVSKETCQNQWERNVAGVGEFLTVQIWKEYEQIERTRALAFTDCSISITCVKTNKMFTFTANLSVLARTSKIIYDMAKDLNKSWNNSNPLQLDKLFEGFSIYVVHMYLCFAYNLGLKFTLLEDVLLVLQLAIKLDNQIIIKSILDMKVLEELIQQQTFISQIQSSCDSTCYLFSVLDFALKHSFDRLVVLCEYCVLSKKVAKNILLEQIDCLPQISRSRLLMFLLQRSSNDQFSFSLSEYQAFYDSLVQNK